MILIMEKYEPDLLAPNETASCLNVYFDKRGRLRKNEPIKSKKNKKKSVR